MSMKSDELHARREHDSAMRSMRRPEDLGAIAGAEFVKEPVVTLQSPLDLDGLFEQIGDDLKNINKGVNDQ